MSDSTYTKRRSASETAIDSAPTYESQHVKLLDVICSKTFSFHNSQRKTPIPQFAVDPLFEHKGDVALRTDIQRNSITFRILSL